MKPKWWSQSRGGWRAGKRRVPSFVVSVIRSRDVDVLKRLPEPDGDAMSNLDRVGEAGRHDASRTTQVSQLCGARP